jgi:myo-inositol-1(or 4)-monophosphatase
VADLNEELKQRFDLAKSVAREAGEMGQNYFRSISELVIEHKGTQDLVSNADREVELFVRRRLSEAFPGDGIVGEEHDSVPSGSGYTWVIDPIDGTANFVRGIPSWCVVLACVHDDQTKIAVVFEPSHDEMFSARLGHGASLNDSPMNVAVTRGLDDGITGVGMQGMPAGRQTAKFITELVERRGVFYRNASGALMLSYVSAGRLIGYVEPFMNAWDCLAGQLLVAEAGGRVEKQSADQMLESGGRVIVASPSVFEELVDIAERTFSL